MIFLCFFGSRDVLGEVLGGPRRLKIAKEHNLGGKSRQKVLKKGQEGLRDSKNRKSRAGLVPTTRRGTQVVRPCGPTRSPGGGVGGPWGAGRNTKQTVQSI